MSLATKTLNKQRRIYFSYLWRGLALMAIGIYAGVMIVLNGMGTAIQTGGGANALVRKLMQWLTERGYNAEQIVQWFMVSLFFIIAVVGLFNVVRGVWLMAPTRTMLGKSILTQKKGSERFQDMMDAINTDMGQEPSVFGSVKIGRKWILDMEAMRIEEIRGVFWFDEGAEDHVLCCVDEAQNIWAASLRLCDDRDKAAEYLKKILPEAAFGDKKAYFLFLGGEEDEEEEGPVIPEYLSLETVLCFVDVDGIPTSNFTYETAHGKLKAMESSQTVALRVISPKYSMVSEVFFQREGSTWNVGILYRQDDEERRITAAVDAKQAEDMLEDLIRQKRLPTPAAAI